MIEKKKEHQAIPILWKKSKVTMIITTVDEKLVHKSAALYDHYLKSRERPMLTLDNYCIRYSLIIERSPIFVPYQPQRFNYYKTKYQNLKRAGLYQEIPK